MKISSFLKLANPTKLKLVYPRHVKVEMKNQVIKGPKAEPGDLWTLGGDFSVMVTAARPNEYGQWLYNVRFPKGRIKVVDEFELKTFKGKDPQVKITK